MTSCASPTDSADQPVDIALTNAEGTRTDDPQRRRPDPTWARELLGRVPQTELGDGLRCAGEYFAEAELNA